MSFDLKVSLFISNQILPIRHIFFIAETSVTLTASSRDPAEMVTLRPVPPSPQGFAYTTPCLVAGTLHTVKVK
jgi:hypothetical protein